MTDKYRLEFKTERQMEVTGTQTTVGVNYITVIAVRIQNNCSNTERIDRPADYRQ